MGGSAVTNNTSVEYATDLNVIASTTGQAITFKSKGGRDSTEVAFAHLTQPAQVRFSAFPRFFGEI